MWLLDQLRFYMTQLRLRRHYRMATFAHEMIGDILDAGLAWPKALPEARLFIAEADQVLCGGRTLT